MTELNFKGKEFVYNHHLAVPFRPLVPDAAKGIGPVAFDGNLIIHGDNLHALKALLPTHAGKIDCVFIDPPYNTGNERWSYNDNVNSPVIKEWLAANPIGIEDGLRHDKWCAMMWPRLRLLHELLADDGSIFITIDDIEISRLRSIMDEIFCSDNFLANFVWQSKDTPGNNSSGIAETHNHVVFYRKTDLFTGNILARSEAQIANYSNPDGDRRGDWLGTPLTRSEHRDRDYYALTNKAGREVFPPKGSSWRRPPTKMQWLQSDNRVWWGKAGDADFPMEKKFLKEVKPGVVNQTWWPYEFAGSTRNAGAELKAIFGGEKPFATPKPTQLIERILNIATDPNSIILDSFAGSGTTAHAVMAVNAADGGSRRFILVEMEDYADTLTAERVRRVINGYAFKGTQKTELLRENLNWRVITNAGDLVHKVEGIENLEAHRFDRIAKQVKDGELIVTGEKIVAERAEGLGGAFTYCTLGPAVELDKILTGETLPAYGALGSALFHMATNRAFNIAAMREADFYLGATEGQHIWLIYKPDLDWLKSPEAALTLSRAKAFAETDKDRRHLVFAPARFVSQKVLADHHLPVEFVPLPFALYRIEQNLIMLRTLEYQDRVLSRLDAYLAALKAEKANADAVADVVVKNPGLRIPIPDFAEGTWTKLGEVGALPLSRAAIPYSPRHDGTGHPVPNVVLKVPTGGGKTFLATQSLSRVFGQYLNKNTGFVLWIVPNEAIFAQTLRHLSDRQHPYRQALDSAAAGRVRIMEKTDRLDARDVEGQLCVMLLMLQSANRETNDTLKMFQDRGDVHGFCPPEGDQAAHRAMIARTPNLDHYAGLWPMVKDSLGNALRIIRPVVVMDEGHKATSDLAFRTLYEFNPCFVLELTATPKDVQPRGGRAPHPGRYANVLVEITGKELDREGMIKMPLNLDARQGADWKATLATALAKLRELDEKAATFRAETNRYIRPIMLVQVERTGADQRASGHIHAEDVRDWLKTAGFDDAEIAIKTAETNDLNQPENLDLLSPTNRVRAIVTKSALQEGWDCPFAYVLCSLAASSNLNAMKQLVGRILRQPGAMKTGVEALDECHVITHHAGTADVVSAVKSGLEEDGLGDLVLAITQTEPGAAAKTTRQVLRRNDFASTEIYLPKVLLVDDGQTRELDYETDVLSEVDWRGFDPQPIADRIPENAHAVENQLQRISLIEGQEHFAAEEVAARLEILRFDPAYAVRMISDIVPNPFVGREIVGRLVTALEKRGFGGAKIGSLSSLIVEELRKGLDAERATRAEAMFKTDVAAGRIQFRLRLDGKNWRMPFTIETTEPDTARQLVGKNGGPLERSLFAPVYENEFNNDERDIAVHLDGDKALVWWHRNVARTQYGMQGWRRAKIYPDFIFAVQRSDKSRRITVLETKGDQLDNLDSAYKRDMLNVLSANFAWDTTVPAGTLELIKATGETVECTLILMSEWPANLPAYLHP